MLLRTGWRLPNSMLFRHRVRRRPHGILRARPGHAVGGLCPRAARSRAALPRGLYFYDDFDVRFSETFYDGTWFDGIDQADLLRCITCPAVYLKAKTNYGKDGTLLAANSDEDAARVQQLVAVCETVVVESGHDIHYERPKTFADAVDRAASVASAK